MSTDKKDEFTESDRAALEHARERWKEHEHRTWLSSIVGKIIKWVLATIAAVTVIADAAQRLWKSLQ